MIQYPESVTVRMTSDMAAELRASSKQFDLSKADLVRDAIASHLDSFRQPAAPTAQQLPLQRSAPPTAPAVAAPTLPPTDSNGIRYYPDIEQGSDEWLAARCGLVTASSVGKLLSHRKPGALDYDCDECGATTGDPCVSMAKRKGDDPPAPIKAPHGARVELAKARQDDAAWIITPASGDDAAGLTLLLAAERITGRVDSVFISHDMYRGKEDEPLARDFYTKHYAPVTEMGFITSEIDGHLLGYSPDGMVGDRGLIEVKSRLQKRHVGTVLNGEVPIENMAQIQCGLLVTGREWCDYVSYSAGMEFWTKRVYPDPVWTDAILAALNVFEENAAQIVAQYRTATAGLPVTPVRIEIPEMVI